MKVTTLIEDKEINQPNLVVEHGSSFHIQTNNYNILFDVGATNKFIENAEKLGILMENVDATIISHGHYDHGGGLSAFFDKNGSAPIYLKETADRKHFSQEPGSDFKDIGLDASLLKKERDRIHFLSENTDILQGVHIITQLKNQYPKPAGNKYLFEEIDGVIGRDDFNHELLLIILENENMCIFTGCSHNGVLNMVETALELYPDKNIKALFGGFHMIGKGDDEYLALSKEEVLTIGDKLMEYPIERVYTGHCTGAKAYSLLKEVMGEKLNYCHTGTIIEL